MANLCPITLKVSLDSFIFIEIPHKKWASGSFSQVDRLLQHRHADYFCYGSNINNERLYFELFLPHYVRIIELGHVFNFPIQMSRCEFPFSFKYIPIDK